MTAPRSSAAASPRLFDLRLPPLTLLDGAAVDPHHARVQWWGPERDLPVLERMGTQVRPEATAPVIRTAPQRTGTGPGLDPSVPTVLVVHALSGDARAAVEHVVLEHVPEGQRGAQEGHGEAGLDEQRRAQRMPRLPPAGAAAGDRAREQLLDRPVDHRHDHEEDRPQQRDPLVVDVVERVGGDREVRERDDAGRRDPDREDLGAGAVALRSGLRSAQCHLSSGRIALRAIAPSDTSPQGESSPLTARGRAASSMGTGSGSPRRSRAARAAPRRPCATSG